MKRAILFFVFCFITAVSFGRNFIYRDGSIIRDSTGNKVKLNGVNLGGWLLWEGWIWGGGFTKEEKIHENLENLLGRVETDSFRMNVYEHFISENDIKSISEMGLNVVRIPFNHNFFEEVFGTFNGKKAGFEVLDRIIGWCRKYHVYAVLDMHAAPGGNSPYFTADPDKGMTIWKSEQNRINTVNLWKLIAQHYKDEPVIAGYDLLNEPIPVKADSLVKMYDRIIAAIRTVDTNHLFILEGSNFAKDFSMFKKLPDRNMMFSFHIYTWLGGEPANKMTDFSDEVKRLDVPMWCGEWGENKYEVVESTLKVLTDTSNRFSGWCFWTWKKVLNSYPALNQITVSQSWIDLIKWCSSGNLKNSPGHDAGLAAMKEFENDMLIANTKRDERLMKLLKDYDDY